MMPRSRAPRCPGEPSRAGPGSLKGRPRRDDPPRVIEALAVLFGVALLAVAALAAPLVAAESVVAAGVLCAGAGLLVGVPTGLWYHVKLRACLRAQGPVPPRWWLRPVALHRRLAPEERPGVLLWFYAGGGGFALSILGCLLVVAGVLLEGFRAGVL